MIPLLPFLFSGCGEQTRDGWLAFEVDAGTHWAQGGFVEMVPPVHLPSNHRDWDQVKIWLRIPAGARLAVTSAGLEWPPGTEADRVEYRGSRDAPRVVDVRGSSVDAEGRRWDHVYRPTSQVLGAPLLGVRWRADDTGAHAEAIDWLMDSLRHSALAAEVSDPDRWVEGVRAKMNCNGCHIPNRPANRSPREFGVVSRGTDSMGWFTPSTILDDEAPLEAYGRWDRNMADPWVHATCAGGEPAGFQRGPGLDYQCADGSVPRARLDLKGALQAGDPHAIAVCASRRVLIAHLDNPPVSNSCEPVSLEENP